MRRPPDANLKVHRGHHLLRAALVGALYLGACSNASEDLPDTQEAPPVTVEGVNVELRPMPRTLQLTGTLRAFEQADVAANVSGRLVAVAVRRGDSVRANDIVARVDVTSPRLALAEAQTSLEVATVRSAAADRECERSRKLAASGALPAAGLDSAEERCQSALLGVRAARVRVDSASRGLADGLIRVPFSGLVAERWVNVGEYVRPETRVVRVVSLDPITLEVSVPEALLAMRAGDAVTFRVGAFESRAFHGTVRSSSPTAREATRDFLVEVSAPNADFALRPGMFATVEAQIAETPAATVPRTAVTQRAGRPRVFAIVNGRVEERAVQTGAERDGVIVIERGIAAGDRVVDRPSADLRNGARVR